MQVMYHFCSKTTIPSIRKHIQPFLVKLHKMLIETEQHIPCLHRNKLVYDFIKVSFCCFVPFYSHQSYIT